MPAKCLVRGSNVVLLVRRSGSIEILVGSNTENKSLDARFSLDLLAPSLSKLRQEARSRTIPGSGVMPKPLVASTEGDQSELIEVFAHVARRGDIAADEEGWVAGPNAPSAIEGLEVSCSRPDVGVSIQYRNGMNAGRWSDWQSPGGFVGTRQKANPLTGIRLKVVGAASQGFELVGEALFLGSPILQGRGHDLGVRLCGRSGSVGRSEAQTGSTFYGQDYFGYEESTSRQSF